MAGIEKDGIRGFRTDTLAGEEFCADIFQGAVEQAVEVAAVALQEKGGEELKAFGLLAKVTRGLDEFFQDFNRQGGQSGRRQSLSFDQILYGFFHVGPSCVLGQNSADYDLEWRFGRPPVTGSEMSEEAVKYFQ